MSFVSYKAEGPVATITLCRPEKLNALTPDMLGMIESFIRRAENQHGLRAVILGAQGRAFCVGADIEVWSALSPAAFRTQWIDAGHRAMDTIARCRLPVIAALHGAVMGGGLELALAADLRVAERGTRLALPETSIGTVPGWGGTHRLPDLIGPARAKQMIFSASQITAEQAETWGLVNVQCAPGTAGETACTIAADVVRQAPVSVQVAKRLIDGAAGDNLPATLEMLGGMATQATHDMQEGIAAFRAKRRPDFKGDQ
ncbi:MAG: enoyl-CoA hydratase/isomerase family protein [Roseitalea sp.]|nr:enoyl-CoA hydratase/isomerase family protein [Roseitalea sp.]MBO6721645.1 enoyl-CoA hydratase/isomerase family protein [Roseitalea sp.]MBO6743567.1 enoyl-CoA hydratase/isomerase family protein [Roseitalea sp.]